MDDILITPEAIPSPGSLSSCKLASLAASSAVALAACGGGGSATPGPTPAPPPVPAGITDTQAARFLLQAQLSASDAEIAALKAQGYSAWLDAQISATASQSATAWLDAKGYNAIDLNTYYFASGPADNALWAQLMTSADAVRKRMALALSEFFVVSLNSLDITWRSHSAATFWDLLSANAFGNYRTLLEQVTLSSAMGQYLNTRGNKKEDAATGRQPDENYAREVMQLFSIGLYELNRDGSYRLDSAGAKIETYTLTDITNLARVFTGWDFDTSNLVFTPDPKGTNVNGIPGTNLVTRPMTLRANLHSTLAASFLGTTIPANTDGITALGLALNAIFNHVNVGPFFSRQMIQRLVTSNPSAAYVDRVAAVFNNNGSGVRGDLKAVFKAILLDDEARNDTNPAKADWGKLREPMLRLVQWGRTFGITSTSGLWKIPDQSDPAAALGQSPLRSGSVFNFFRPGYVPPGTAMATSGVPAPEFQLVNESSVAGYVNTMQTRIRNGFNTGDITAAYANELALVTDTTALVDRLNLLLCANQLSLSTRNTIIAALNATSVTASSTASAKLDRVASAVLMVMCAPEYLVQK
jgi:uncharacterized protein (DUF1800 family)